MAFKLNTDKVNSVAESISSLSSEASSVSSSISGYDGSNEDGFNFSGAIAAIANNVSGMETKFKNTVALLNAVTGTHTSLQESANGDLDGSGDDTSGYVSSGRVSGGSGRRSGGGSAGLSSSAITASANLFNGSPAQSISTPSGSIDTTSIPTTETPTFTSAREVLMQELGAPLANVVSTLNENLDVTLSANKIDTIETDDLGVLSNGRAIIVVEGHSDDTTLPLYLKRVSKVAEEFNIELKFLKLDSIVASPFKAGSTTTNTADSEDKTKETKVDEKEESKEETTNENETKLETEENTSEEEKKEEKNNEILDKETYERLTILGTSTYKNNILNSPVTLIVKNNKIVSSMNGHITEMTLRSMIQLSGITK